MAGPHVRRLLLTNIPYAQLLVARGRHQQVAAGVPGEGLDDVVVLQLQGGLSSANIPQLDGEVARGRGKNIFSRGVEENLANLSM